MAGLLGDWANKGLSNPLTHMGLGLLAADAPMMSTNLSDFNGRGLAGGLLGGIRSYDTHQNSVAQRANREALVRAKQQDLMLKQAKAQRDAQAAQQQAEAGEAFRQALATPNFPREKLVALAHAAGAKPGGLLPPVNDPNKMFAPDGSPNQAAQDLAIRTAAASGTKIGDIIAGGGPVFGKVDPGTVMRQDEQGGWYQEVIPGSKADIDRKRQAQETRIAHAKSAAKYRNNIREADGTLAAIDRAFELVDWTSTGAFGELAEINPQSKASRLKERLSTLKSKIVRDTMAQMRALSSTGSTGFGNTNESELKLLEDSIASLAKSTGEKEILENLQIVRTHYGNLIHALKKDRLEMEQAVGPGESGSNKKSSLSAEQQKKLREYRKKFEGR